MTNPYREKLLSIQFSPSVFPSREKKVYYDRESVHEVFGEDAFEQMMEETDGQGPAYLSESAAAPELGDVEYRTADDYLDGPDAEPDD